MSIVKALSLVLAVSLGLSGSVTVLAQSKESSTAPPTPVEAQPAQSADKESPPESVYQVGAKVATAVNIPMRGILCIAGGAAGFLVLVLTFGSGYRAAALVVEEGCSGPWIITPEHLKGTDQAKSDTYPLKSDN